MIVLAQEESRLLGHDHIGTEHLLLGLVADREGIAAGVLTELGIDLGTARSEVEEVVGRGTLVVVHDAEEDVLGADVVGVHVQRRPQRTLERLLGPGGEGDVTTRHLIAAAAVLAKHGASPEAVRAHVRSRLEAGPAPVPAPPVCGRCGATLTDALTTTEVQLPEHEGDGRLAVAFARCASCGAVVGVFSGGA